MEDFLADVAAGHDFNLVIFAVVADESHREIGEDHKEVIRGISGQIFLA